MQDADTFHRLLEAAKWIKSMRAPLPVAKEGDAGRMSPPQEESTPKGDFCLEPPPSSPQV
jgi:hypothetical protein